MDPDASEIVNIGELSDKPPVEFNADKSDLPVETFAAEMDCSESENPSIKNSVNTEDNNQIEEATQDEPMDTTEHQEVNTNGDVTEDPCSKNAVEDISSPETNDTSPKNTTSDESNEKNEETMENSTETSETTAESEETPSNSDNTINESEEKLSKDVETQMETENQDGNEDEAKSISSGEDCVSDLEKEEESKKLTEEASQTPPEQQVESVIETLDEIDMQLCSIEEENLCFVCKKTKMSKYSFTKRCEDVEELKECHYICGDVCFGKLEPHCAKIHTPAYFHKKFHVVEEAPVKYRRKCKQCTKEIDEKQKVSSWEAMDFCREHCLYRYQLKFTKKCSECEKKVEYHQLGKYAVRFGSIIRQFCSGACLDTRKKKIRLCTYCQLAMTSTVTATITIGQKFFCTFKCRDKYVQLTAPNKPPYVPNKDTHCFMCSDPSKALTKEFSYLGISSLFCGDGCLTRFVFLHNFNGKVGKCHNCWKHATLNELERFAMHYDGAFNHFCSPTCQYLHIITHRKIMPCVWCKVKKYNFDLIQQTGVFNEVIFGCSLNCFNQLSATLDKLVNKSTVCEHCAVEKVTCEITAQDGRVRTFCSKACVAEFQSKCRKRESRSDAPEVLPQIASVRSLAKATGEEKKLIFIQEEEEPEVANKMCQVRVMSEEQGTQFSRETAEQEAQTDFKEELRLRAVPVPLYVPQPLHMWNCPVPRAVPFPLVVPLPMLIPLTRDSSTEYLKTMKKEPVKTPRDPFEQELLMMAELVAAEKPKEEVEEPDEVEDFSPEQSEPFTDDVLQMALKMASDYHESAVDLEGALQANTITPGHHPMEQLTSSDEIIHTEPLAGGMRGSPRGRSRGRGSRGPRGGTSSRGRGRGRPAPMTPVPMPEPTPPPPPEPVEKPDAHMCLKYTFGVNAWKQWVTTKNADLERSSRKLKLFKTDLLQMTADELNYSLCLFVNEVRKPNGTEYAPDTIYYLCLGIQQYLYECGRIDNIFCDSFYEKFTDCLDDVCGKFSSLYSDSHYIVTRVEEEHLWESKQLGAHSPFVLLTTLMFFNTKHFNLTSVEEHMQLSFSHIMKHWKRNPGQGGSRQMPAGGRNVLLRFYPPQNAQANARKKKVYEQQENEDNPLRCPVKLYEFYLSKCPESVKTRNDVFYLLPERSCVPESPVWYSTMALDIRALKKMLHRVKMVKEINVALLTH